MGDRLREGDTLRWLATLALEAGQRREAIQYAAEATAILELLPPGPELGAGAQGQRAGEFPRARDHGDWRDASLRRLARADGAPERIAAAYVGLPVPGRSFAKTNTSSRAVIRRKGSTSVPVRS